MNRGMTAPAVSVIVPAYGVAHYLGEALRSLQAQSFSDWEAVVVDDGAPDDVAGAVAAFADDPRIRLLATDNGGLAVARNRGVAAARAPRIALLDGDDLYEPAYLERMVAALDAAPDIGFVTCDATLFGIPSREGHLFSRYAPQEEPITLERVLTRQFNIFGSCTMRRIALDDVGGWNAKLRSAEDLDLWVRLLGAGWHAARVDAPLLRYRRRADSLSAATIPLLKAEQDVYARAAVRLEGRPEAAAARAGVARTEALIAFEEGEALVLDGRVRDGVRRFRSAGDRTRSPLWRVMLATMSAVPATGPPFMRWRMRRADPAL